jgi:hypothetical protein
MTEKELRYSLVEYLGHATGSFNSGFNKDLEYTDSDRLKRSTTMFNWFLPPAIQFPNGFRSQIGEWRLERSKIAEKEIEIEEYGNPVFGNDIIRIFIPKTQNTEWTFLEKALGRPAALHQGFLTPSGRSFWVLAEDGETFGLKFHVEETSDSNAIIKKWLDPVMIKNTIETDRLLKSEKEAMQENYGCFFNIRSGENKIAIGYIFREFKWDLIDVKIKDVFLPLTALLSQAFWSLKELLQHLELPSQNKMKDWIVGEMAPHFADVLYQSIFETGLHPEMHQQNLTVHLGEGRIQNLIYQDLQDCLYDPVTRFLIANTSIGPDTDKESLETRRLIALPGEILTPDNKDKLCVQIADWWRRWVRIFGRYDRIINFLSGDDLFATSPFEDAVVRHLKTKCEEAGLQTRETDNMDLYQIISWAQFSFQQERLQNIINNSELTNAHEIPPLFERGCSLSTARAPWNREMLLQRLEQQGAGIFKFKSSDDFLVFKDSKEVHLYYYRNI